MSFVGKIPLEDPVDGCNWILQVSLQMWLDNEKKTLQPSQLISFVLQLL